MKKKIFAIFVILLFCYFLIKIRNVSHEYCGLGKINILLFCCRLKLLNLRGYNNHIFYDLHFFDHIMGRIIFYCNLNLLNILWIWRTNLNGEF